ncbi:MAG: hypothetical protein OEN52_08705 [Gammaproteobacteria bacterium]|nr:hypothetical protein [Gammaproteobacteria bacterium]
MSNRPVLVFLLGILAGSPVLAQEGSKEPPNPCTIEPIFHCAETMGDGSFIAHFGYRTTCPETDKPAVENYIPIGDDNYFAPEPVDRGQPTVFIQGEHVDEFEAEFSAEELKKGKKYGWTVLKIGAPVDFSKTKDASLDCTNLPY